MSTVVQQIIKVTCDGPNCTGPKGEGSLSISWDEMEVQTNPEALPDEAYRLLILSNFNGGKVVFCKPECLRDFMRTYVPPLSPSEKRKQDENNLAVEAAKQKDVPQIDLPTGPLGALPGRPAFEVIDGRKVGAITPPLAQVGSEPTGE